MRTAIIACLFSSSLALIAKDRDVPEELTLRQAESLALQNIPQIGAANFKREAAMQAVREARAGFFPQVTGNASLVGAGSALGNNFAQAATPIETRIGATGALSNSTVFSRESNGLTISQLITDFGRTSRLTSASRFQALSEAQILQLVKMQAVLSVDEAYFRTQEAESVLRVANEVVSDRQLLFEQISVLAANKLKSELDVSVAKVSLGEGNLLLLQAQNNVEKAFADLSQSLGYRDRRRFSLKQERQLPMESDLSPLVRQALELRPDALALRHQKEAAYKFAAAEGAARYPKITALGSIGITPAGDDRVTGNYAAAGVNVEVSVFDGGRLSARFQEASLKAKAAQKAVDEIEDQIVKDVTVSWFNAASALKKIDVTKDLVANASEALELAQARYNLGSVSIIELSQAQLNKTQAEITYASAKYEYQISRATLEFETGALSLRIPGKPAR